MASNYTENYGLCQWEPGDNFVRTEFNQDNARIDAALAAAEAETARVESLTGAAQAAADYALDALGPVAYNVYGLMLQQSYEGKPTAFKKALVFDGFVDGSMTASMSAGLVRSQNRITATRTGQGNIDLGYSSEHFSVIGGAYTQTCTAKGNGNLTGLRVKTIHKSGGSASGTVTWQLRLNGSVSKQGSAAVSFGPEAQEQTISVPSTGVTNGDTIQFYLSAGSSEWRLFLGGPTFVGGTVLISSTGITGGTITTPWIYSLPERRKFRAWVRYSGGSVGLSVQGTGGLTAFSQVGTRSTTEPGGSGCTEAEFALEENVPQDTTLSFRLTLDLGASTTMYVYDYGIVLL